MLRRLRPGAGVVNGNSTSVQHEAVVNSYKELIKRQDEHISSLTQQLKKLNGELEKERNELRNAQQSAEKAAEAAALLSV